MSLWACSLLKEGHSVWQPALRSTDTSSGTPFLPPRHSCLQAVWTSRLIQPLLAPFSQVPRWARARVGLRAPACFCTLLQLSLQQSLPFAQMVLSSRTFQSSCVLPRGTCCIGVLRVLTPLPPPLHPGPCTAPGQVEEMSGERW